MTLHPSPDKNGVNIDKMKYNAIREAIISAIKEKRQIRFSPHLLQSVKSQ